MHLIYRRQFRKVSPCLRFLKPGRPRWLWSRVTAPQSHLLPVNPRAIPLATPICWPCPDPERQTSNRATHGSRSRSGQWGGILPGGTSVSCCILPFYASCSGWSVCMFQAVCLFRRTYKTTRCSECARVETKWGHHQKKKLEQNKTIILFT